MAIGMPTKSKAKTRVKKELLKGKTLRMTLDEKRLVRDMVFERKTKPSEAATAMGRHISSITRLLAQKRAPNPVGRPKGMSEEQIDRAVKVLEEMVDEADAEREITCAMIRRRCRLKICERVLSNALHARGYWFRGLRKKMILTPDDVKQRYDWSKQYRNKPKSWWLKRVQIHLDNHHFKVATTAKSRSLLAKRRVRGVYRKKQKSLRSGHVKPDPKLRLNTGTKGILKMGGVGGGRVLVWHTVQGTWSGATAASAYKDVVLPALKKHYKGRKSFVILEDNDPTGNLSKVAVAVKRETKMVRLEIPKRSPDLNVLDFAIWSEVERLMRKQERNMKKGRRETRAEFEKRLDKTAFGLPESFINDSIGDLKRRCNKLYAVKGGLFEEGGRSKRPL